MKPLLITLFLFTGIAGASAQIDSISNKFRLGVATNASFSNSGNELTYSLLGTISNNKHQFDLGPKVQLNSLNYYTNKVGVEFNYRFYPNTIQERFSSFLWSNAEFFNKTLERDYQVVTGNSPVVSVHQKATRRYYSVHLGYGIRFRLVDQFYISSNVGVGYFIEDYDDARVASDPNYSSWKRYTFGNLGLNAQVILGFRF